MFFLPLYPPNDPPLIILKINSEYIIQRLLLCPQAPRTNVPTSKALLSKKKKRRRSKHKKKHTIQYEIGGDSRFFLFTYPLFFFFVFFFSKIICEREKYFFFGRNYLRSPLSHCRLVGAVVTPSRYYTHEKKQKKN